VRYTILVPVRHAGEVLSEERLARDFAASFESVRADVNERHTYQVDSEVGQFYMAMVRLINRLWTLGVPEVICEVDGHRVASSPEGSRWV